MMAWQLVYLARHQRQGAAAAGGLDLLDDEGAVSFLPAPFPEHTRTRARNPQRAVYDPSTPVADEEAVAYVWRDVLGVPRVGRKDDFFALGGRSLLLPRVRHRLEQELGVRLSLASLLERTTAAALALAAEELLLDELERELAAAR